MRCNTHNFHLMMTDELKDKVINLSEKLKISISDTAVFIIKKTMNILKNYNYNSEELNEFSQYQQIFCEKDMHIYMEKRAYRKIKHLCATMFVFSIAIMVRWMLKFYFDNEENIEKELEILNKKIEYFEKNLKSLKKEIKSEELFGNPFYKLTFNNKFTLIAIDFL